MLHLIHYSSVCTDVSSMLSTIYTLDCPFRKGIRAGKCKRNVGWPSRMAAIPCFCMGFKWKLCFIYYKWICNFFSSRKFSICYWQLFILSERVSEDIDLCGNYHVQLEHNIIFSANYLANLQTPDIPSSIDAPKNETSSSWKMIIS